MSEQPTELDHMIVTFVHDETIYGIYANHIMEIIPVPKLTPIPKIIIGVRGLFTYKGAITPVMSLAQLCGHADSDGENACIVLQNNDRTFVGLSVCSVNELIAESSQKLTYTKSASLDSPLVIQCVLQYEKPVMIIDVESTFNSGS